MRGICDGLQVVEAGAGSIGGALAAMMLADYGAHVVKVEPPEGDRLRQQHAPGFLVWNRGKDSRVADLRTDAGRSEFRELTAAADVVIEGFGAGVADAWEIGYDALREANPSLIYCSIKGFGSRGKYADLPAYEGIVSAKAGVYSRGAWGFREGPTFHSAFLASGGAGQMAVAGILGGLIAREQTGKGQRLEATMVQGLNSLDYFGTMTYQHQMRLAAAGSSSAPTGKVVNASRYSFFAPTKDGRWIATTQMLPHQARALSRAVGLAHTFDDPRYADQPQFATAEDAQDWENLVWEALSQQPYEYWEKALLAEPDIAFELARTCEEGLDHPQIRHNGEAVVLVDPEIGEVEEVGPVAQFADSPARIERSAPRLGQVERELAARPQRTATGTVLEHALSGVTVVELGYFYAMPNGTAMATALGARVIKVEGLDGDPQRNSFGAAETGAAKAMEGKESLALDVRTDEGRAIVQQLAANADAFVNGFRPGVAERLGFDYETLAKLNPRLVYLHASGYGSDGPYAMRPIYAQVAQAVAGSIGRFAGQWLDPDRTAGLPYEAAQAVVLPRLRGPVDGDANASLAVLSSLLFGLYDQRMTGTGQFGRTSMIGGNAIAYADDFVRYAGKPPLPVPDEEAHGLNALYRLYKTVAGWVFLAVTRDNEWRAFTAAIEQAQLGEDARFSTAALRQTHDAELSTVIEAVFAKRTASEWEDLLVPAGVACVEAFAESHSAFTSTDPVMFDTGLVVEVEHPYFGTIRRHGLPVEFSDTPGRAAPGCLIGQHTVELLTELGYTPEQIKQLETDNVIGIAQRADNQ